MLRLTLFVIGVLLPVVLIAQVNSDAYSSSDELLSKVVYDYQVDYQILYGGIIIENSTKNGGERVQYNVVETFDYDEYTVYTTTCEGLSLSLYFFKQEKTLIMNFDENGYVYVYGEGLTYSDDLTL